MFGYCADCDMTRELDQHGNCSNCGSIAISSGWKWSINQAQDNKVKDFFQNLP